MLIHGSLRKAAKAAVFALICAPVAALAHRLGGGTVSPESLLLGAMPIGAAAYLCALRGPRKAVWLFGVFLLAQASLHSLFAVSATGHAVHDPRQNAVMMLLHLGATAIAVLWVVKIEPGLPRLHARLAAAATGLLNEAAAPPVRPSRPRPAPPRRDAPHGLREAVGAVGRRGPPTCARFRTSAHTSSGGPGRAAHPRKKHPQCTRTPFGVRSRAPPSRAPPQRSPS